MRLIVCLDDKNGMAFNHRRQSRDRIITETIEELVKGSTLHFSPIPRSYSLLASSNRVRIIFRGLGRMTSALWSWRMSPLTSDRSKK